MFQRTFRGLTWKRYGVFCLVVLVLALSESPAIRGLLAAASWRDYVLAVGRPWVYVLLTFTPVFLAVIAAGNLAPQHHVRALAIAVVAGQAAGTILWAVSVPRLYPEGFAVHYLTATPDAWTRFRFFAGNGLLFLGISAVATTFWYLLQRNLATGRALARERERAEEIEREQTEAHLAAMQAQIEPHFLFNTLASVRRLFETDARAGHAMLQHLVSYLTTSLPTLRESRSTLGREIELAVAYLNVQKYRMGARLSFAIDAPAALREVVVPPMMLATLVENAVIHGLAPLPAGGAIRISARAENGKLELEVADTGRGMQSVWGAGIGLSNIIARLQSQFGGAAGFNIANQPGGGTLATLTLPVPGPGAPA